MAGRVRERKLTNVGAPTQHPTCEEGVVGVRFEGDDAVGDVGEGIGEKANVCTDVDGRTAARYQLCKNREFGLARACLLRDALPVEHRWRHQHRETFAQGQWHQRRPSLAGSDWPTSRTKMSVPPPGA